MVLVPSLKGGAIICAETTANFNISREWQTPATLKLPVPILNLRKLATRLFITGTAARDAEDGESSAFHVLFSRAFSESISNVNLSFCTIRNIFNLSGLLERVGSLIRLRLLDRSGSDARATGTSRAGGPAGHVVQER